MRLLIAISFFILCSEVNGQTDKIKLITPGEHLGFKLESFDKSDRLAKLSISQGEMWTALYMNNGTFTTKKEKLNWDTTKNFTILSPSGKQPEFYFQGLDDFVQKGEAKTFNRSDFKVRKPLMWTLKGISFLILYSKDENCTELISYKYGVISTDSEFALFKGLNSSQVDKLTLREANIVKLFWTGDLNGDGEPDFLLGLKSHHEVPTIELIISTKRNGKIRWKRVARFTEWS
jgi:hypothetical protein